MTSTSDFESYGIFLVLIVLIVGRRIVATIQGAPLRPARLVVFAAFYIVLFAISVGFDLLFEPLWTGAVDVAVLVAVGALLPSLIVSHVTVYRGPGGAWYYKLGAWVLGVYLILFITRIGIEIGILGINPFGSVLPSTSFTTEQLALLALVDGLFAFSTGLLVARTVAVYRAYQRALASEPKPAPEAPLA